jgi:tetratricopeptide (TPR) repeat protein
VVAAILTALSDDEKQRIGEILTLTPAEARAAMKDACHELLVKYGDLAPLIDHLGSVDESPQRAPLLAIASIANGDIPGAEKALAGMAVDPAADAWTLAELGRLKEMQGRTDEAIALFNRALERIDEPGARFALNVRSAQLLYDAGKPKEAGDTLRALLKAAPDSPVESVNFLARIAGMHDDHALVAELFQPVGNAKELPLNFLYLGETMLKLGKAGSGQATLRVRARPVQESPATDAMSSIASSARRAR